MGYTVNLQPQPFTEPSLVNFQRNSSPGSNKTIDQELELSTNRQDGLQELSCGIFSNKYNGIISEFREFKFENNCSV
jgi:hypothetical protein